MKKILALGMLGLMIAAAFALGTSATFRDYKSQRSLHIAVVTDDNELIDLTPGQPYAYINDKGKLVIDFSKNNPNWPGNPENENYNESWATYVGENEEYVGRGIGISPDSRYNFDHMFNVSNHLWEDVNITVRVRSSNSNIVFYNPEGKIYKFGTYTTPTNSDEAQSHQTVDVCFVLKPGESVGIGMDVFGGHLGDSYDATITIQAWPEDKAPFDCPPAIVVVGGGS